MDIEQPMDAEQPTDTEQPVNTEKHSAEIIKVHWLTSIAKFTTKT